jgi:MFS family permease
LNSAGQENQDQAKETPFFYVLDGFSKRKEILLKFHQKKKASMKKSFAQNQGFYTLLGGLSFFYLLIIWTTEFLPMQDLPQHLFQTLAYTLKGSDHPWTDLYDIGVVFGPYSFFYYFTAFSYYILGDMLLAGKLYVSFCFLGFVLLALSASELNKKRGSLWPILLILPIFFNQTYFLGFTGYILAVPISLYLLLEYYKILIEKKEVTKTLHTLLVLGHILLFLSHPHPFAIYLFLVSILLFWSYFKKNKSLLLFLYPVISGISFIIWFYLKENPASHLQPFSSLFRWWPFKKNLFYLFQFFTGMKISENLDFISIFFWSLTFLAPLYFILKKERIKNHLRLIFFVVFSFFLLLYFLAPMYIYPTYTYVNTRLAPFVYLAFVLFLSQIKSNKFTSAATVLASFYFAFFNFFVHRGVSKEISEIKESFEALPKGSTFLPLLFSSDSKFLDSSFFFETHTHVHYYYHIQTQDGVSFALFQNPLQAVRFKNPEAALPTPGGGRYFSWRRHGELYPYILVRHPTEYFYRTKPVYFKEVKQSGPWHVFERL